MAINLDTLVVNGGTATAGGGDYELIDQGTYVVSISDITPFEGRNFKTGEPETKLKFIYTVEDDPRNTAQGWEGITVDELVAIPKNMANEKATLGIIWQAATGEKPVEGGQYPIKKGLVGRKLMLVVGHRTSQGGSVWPQVRDHLSLPAAGSGRRRPVAQVVVDNDDDDLRNA